MRFQWQQIAALGLHEGELQELEAEQRELSNAEGILAALSEAGGLMENDETGVLAALKTAEAALQRIGGVLEGTSRLGCPHTFRLRGTERCKRRSRFTGRTHRR